MQRSVNRSSLLALCLVLSTVISGWRSEARAADTPPEPVRVIEGLAKVLLENLGTHRPAYRQDAMQLRKMVDESMRPLFDAEFAAQRVLAQQWNNADPTQRSRFLEAFYQTVLRSYSQAILELTAEQLVQLPFRADENPDLAEVRYEVRKEKTAPVLVSYLLRRDDGRWKIWDLKFEGLSYVKAYQLRMSGEVQKFGLDGAIEKLEAQVGIDPAATAAK